MNFFHHPTVSRCAPTSRKLRLEPLEDRRMLAVFTVDNLNDSGLGSLRQAIDDANTAFGADTIEFQAGLSGTIALSTGEMLISDGLTIDGPGAELLTIDAQQNSRILRITSTTDPVRIEGLYLTGGNGAGSGGAILSSSQRLLSIENSTIANNVATSDFGGRGGGVWARGDVTVIRSMISGNWTTFTGAGIHSDGDVTVTSSVVSGNLLTSGRIARGGGIHADGEVTVTNSVILGNSAAGSDIGEGGGISSYGHLTVINSYILSNSVVADGIDGAARGGGIQVRGEISISQGSTISENSANGNLRTIGGGVSAYGNVSVEQSRVFGNSAVGGVVAGGGIGTGADVTINDSIISGNSAVGSADAVGGGIFADGNVTITATAISDNAATGRFEGAGGGIRASGDVTVTGSTVSDNLTSGEVFDVGGGISASGDVTVTASTISGNSTTGHTAQGGGILARGMVNISSSTISNNSARGQMAQGGGIRSFGDVTVLSSTISGNVTTGSFLRGGLSGGSGVWVEDDSVIIENSIVAGNRTMDGFGPDLRSGTGPLTVRYSLIGDNTGTGLSPAPVGMPDANGNLIGTAAAPIDPLLGPLQDNGGPTFTHALLAGSPAIDAGELGSAPPPATDQRGFVRIVDGGSGQKIIDMGAYEYGATLAADGNGDGFVGDEDYTVWANNFGLSGDDIPGDYNNDGIVGPQDYTVWANNFGAGTPPGESVVSLRPVEPALQQGATGSASALAAEGAANLEQNSRPVEPVLPTATLRRDKRGGSLAAAHDAAIQELMIEGLGRHDLVPRSSIDHIWALLNAGLLETDRAEMLHDVSERGS